jgi:hypothetical protein
MKVLTKLCQHCGHVHLYSVEVLVQPNSAGEFGVKCTSCSTPLTPACVAEELDIQEVAPEPDVERILETIRSHRDDDGGA